MCSAAAGASGRSLDVRVASNEDGESRGRRGAIMGGTGFRPTGSFFVIDYLAPWSIQPPSSPLPSARPAADSSCPGSSSSSLVLCLLFALPLSSPPRLRPVVPLLLSSRLFSLLRTPVSRTLAKPRRRQRLSCRSTRPLSVSTEMVLVVSSPLSSSYRDHSRSSPSPHFSLRF